VYYYNEDIERKPAKDFRSNISVKRSSSEERVSRDDLQSSLVAGVDPKYRGNVRKILAGSGNSNRLSSIYK
jgi:hypothetical protein